MMRLTITAVTVIVCEMTSVLSEALKTMLLLTFSPCHDDNITVHRFIV